MTGPVPGWDLLDPETQEQLLAGSTGVPAPAPGGAPLASPELEGEQQPAPETIAEGQPPLWGVPDAVVQGSQPGGEFDQGPDVSKGGELDQLIAPIDATGVAGANVAQRKMSDAGLTLDPADIQVQKAAAIDAKAGIESDGLDAQAGVIEDFRTDEERRLEAHSKRQAAIATRKAEAQAKMVQDTERFEKARVDPDKYFSDASTARNVGRLIFAVMAGLGSAWKGQGDKNPALDIINGHIDRSIKLQMYQIKKLGDSIGHTDRLIAQLSSDSRSEAELYERMRAVHLAQTNLRIDAIAKESKSAMAKANAEALKAALSEEHLASKARAAQKRLENSWRDREVGVKEGTLDESIRSNKAGEKIRWANHGETRRHNKAQEGIGWTKALTEKAKLAFDQKQHDQAALEKLEAGLVTSPVDGRTKILPAKWVREDKAAMRDLNATLTASSQYQDNMTEISAELEKVGRISWVGKNFLADDQVKAVEQKIRQAVYDRAMKNNPDGKISDADYVAAKKMVQTFRSYLRDGRSEPWKVMDLMTKYEKKKLRHELHNKIGKEQTDVIIGHMDTAFPIGGGKKRDMDKDVKAATYRGDTTLTGTLGMAADRVFNGGKAAEEAESLSSKGYKNLLAEAAKGGDDGKRKLAYAKELLKDPSVPSARRKVFKRMYDRAASKMSDAAKHDYELRTADAVSTAANNVYDKYLDGEIGRDEFQLVLNAVKSGSPLDVDLGDGLGRAVAGIADNAILNGRTDEADFLKRLWDLLPQQIEYDRRRGRRP